MASSPLALLNPDHEATTASRTSWLSYNEATGRLSLAKSGLVQIPIDVLRHYPNAVSLDLSGNQLRHLGQVRIDFMPRLSIIDLSDNPLGQTEEAHEPDEDDEQGDLIDVGLDVLPSNISELSMNRCGLRTIPHGLSRFAGSLTTLSLAGNFLTDKRGLAGRSLDELAHLSGINGLRRLSLSGNRFDQLPGRLCVALAQSLETLHVAGNGLRGLPEDLGKMRSLQVLHLNDNELATLPNSFVALLDLRVLFLHRNRFEWLPVELVALRNLRSLSVRENPLLSRFVEEYKPNVPSLMELAARAVRKNGIHDTCNHLPPVLTAYLDGARVCHGCQGAVFGKYATTVNFVDLCGAYHVPFLQFLCSERCLNETRSQEANGMHLDPVTRLARLRKVLLDRYAPSMSAPIENLREELLELEDLFC